MSHKHGFKFWEPSGQHKVREEMDVDWRQAYDEQMEKCTFQLASVGSDLHPCGLLKKKGEALPDTHEMKALTLKQLGASSTSLEREKQKRG